MNNSTLDRQREGESSRMIEEAMSPTSARLNEHRILLNEMSE